MRPGRGVGNGEEAKVAEERKDMFDKSIDDDLSKLRLLRLL